MFKQLSALETIAVLIASFAIGATALSVALRFTLTPAYPEFIVGSLAWQAQTKFQDLVSPPILLAALIFSLWLFSRLIRQLRIKFGQASADELTHQLLWWSVPFAVGVGGSLLGFYIERKVLWLSAVGLLPVAASASYCLLRGIRPSPMAVGLSLVGVLLVGLTPLEFALALGRAPTSWTGQIGISRYAGVAYVIAITGVMVVTLMAARTPDLLYRRMPLLLLIGQLGLPVFFLTLYPARLVPPSGGIMQYHTTAWLKLLLIALLLWGLFDVVQRYRRSKLNNEKDWTQLLSPVAIFALLIAFKFGTTVAPNILEDDYHVGERLLGWWSYLHGIIPYVGYVPAHGLIGDDLPGWLSLIFYDGTAASMLEAGRLASALLAFIAYLSIYRFSGSVGLAFVSTMLLGGTLSWSFLSWSFLTPFICLWLSATLLANPVRWITIWLISAPIVILGAPAQGLSLVAASGVIVIWNAWRLWKERKEVRWRGMAVAVSLLILGISLIPVMPMLSAAVRYVFENGPINQLAYGIPWEASWKAGEKSSLVFEVVRMSWIVVPLVSLAVVLSTPKDSRYRHLLPAFVVLLFSLLLMPYSMGRIDPQGLSRPGLVAIFGWTVLIPVVMWPLLQRSERAFFIVCVAGISAALQFGSLSLSSLISSVSPTVATGPLRDGKLVGLSNLGVAAVQDDHWHRLLRLNALLAGKLSPMETYLDLTNRTAHYFYLNRIPAMAVTAPYNMVPVPQQQRAIAVLSNNLPRVALLEANNILHDGGAGGLALRAPLLYRFVLDHYVPAWEDGFVVGYRHQDAAKHDNRQVRISIKDVTDNDWDSGVHRRENALLISDTFPVEGLSPGTAVQLESGTRHKITRISRETKVVWLDGPIAAPSKMGTRGFFTANIDAAHNINFQLALLDKAFSIPDLNKIPAAWGRSERSLVKRMELIKSLDGMSAANDNPRSDPQLSRLSANETQVTFDLSNSHVGGRNAGLLRFEFTCSGKKAEPKIQVFWWGDDQTGPTELSSLRFSAVGGVLIVPLDVYPRWLTLRKVLGIRINLNNAAACEVSSIRNVSLHQRTLLLAR